MLGEYFMKKLLTTFLAVGFAATSLIGCNKNKGNKSGPSDGRHEIRVVDVFGVDVPSTLVANGDLLAELDTNSEQYSLDSSLTCWTYLDQDGARRDLPKSYRMTFETAYSLKLVLHASEGFKFAKNTTITISSIAESLAKDIYNNGSTIEFYKTFDPISPVVDRVAIQGVTEPVDGETATTTGINLYNCEGARVELGTSSTYWIYNNYKFENGNEFVAGREYTIKIRIEARSYQYNNENKYCTYATNVAVTINGRSVSNITTSSDGRTLTANYSFIASAVEN